MIVKKNFNFFNFMMNEEERLRFIAKTILDDNRREANNDWLSVEFIADDLKMKQSTIRTWCRKGKLKSTRFGKMIRVKTKDYREFCEKGI